MDAESPMEVEFLREQERRRKKNLSVDLYDVLGWSLPALSNLDMVSCEADLGNADLMAWASPHKAAPIGGPALAYLIPWGKCICSFFVKCSSSRPFSSYQHVSIHSKRQGVWRGHVDRKA